MKQTRSLMGMTITVDIVDPSAKEEDINDIFDYFVYIDEKFSTYKKTSEVSKINRGELKPSGYSLDMRTILLLCKQTKKETKGYFDIYKESYMDPSGLVKGWAIKQASEILKNKGFKNFYVDAGGDIQVCGENHSNDKWSVGIKNPFKTDEIVKTLKITDGGVATSGNYIRGQHVYNPHQENKELKEIVSLTVIGPNVYEADRFATAAFAMQEKGIYFIENLPGFEGYMIDKNGMATYTSGFNQYVLNVTIQNGKFAEQSSV